MLSETSEKLIQKLLLDRGIPLNEQKHFLHPDFVRDTHSPWLLPDIEKAVSRLITAHETQEKIIIFGDYDADGVPATALLIRTLRMFGFKHVHGMIPTRTQGYGLTASVVESLLALQPAIVIAVDNGTVAKEEVAALSAGGIAVIIADHHEPQEGKIADAALAIINPKMPESTYPFRELCACALAWKLACALGEKLEQDAAQLKWELDLVGLSTIADMVPLIGENRVLAHFGLKVLSKTRNLGLKALIEMSGIRGPELTAGDVGFKLAPRINAPSRLHDELLDGEHSSLSLLTTENKQIAESIAEHLHLQNAERQKMVDIHLVEARIQGGATDAGVIVAFHESWSSGVIGLVASRLIEQYKRPVVVLAPEGTEVKGSVRSVDGIHALELLEAGSTELERFGGHAKAAGLTLKGDINTFRALLEAHIVEKGITVAELAKMAERKEDLCISLADLNLDLAALVKELEPFGVGFPTPLFAVEANVTNVRPVGAEGKHMSFFLSDGSIERKAIAFSYRGPILEVGQKYLFRVNVEAEEWRSVTSVVAHVRSVEMLDNAPQTA